MVDELYYTENAASSRTAKDLTWDYWSVPAGDDTVSINKYKIAGSYGGKKGDLQNAKIDAVLAAATAKGKGPRSGVFVRAKNGKASPADFEHIFDMALKSGHLKQEALQGWADDNLGVDCTGFAVAYLDSLGLIDRTKYSGGTSCPWLLGQARLAGKKNGIASALIWEFGDVAADDLILWMYDTGQETRTPGHISVVSKVKTSGQVLLCAESSGELDDSGHSGPRIKDRPWSGVKSVGGKKYVDLNGAQVIIVRVYDSIG
jgi:hypothetical protein